MDFVDVYSDSSVVVSRVFRHGEFVYTKTRFLDSDGMTSCVVYAYPDGRISTEFYR